MCITFFERIVWDYLWNVNVRVRDNLMTCRDPNENISENIQRAFVLSETITALL